MVGKFKKYHLEKNKLFFSRLLRSRNNREVKNCLKEATSNRLRSLVLLIGDFYLKRLPISPHLSKKLSWCRKKLVLKKYFGSKKKLNSFLVHRELWGSVLQNLAPCIQPLVANLFSPAYTTT